MHVSELREMLDLFEPDETISFEVIGFGPATVEKIQCSVFPPEPDDNMPLYDHAFPKMMLSLKIV